MFVEEGIEGTVTVATEFTILSAPRDSYRRHLLNLTFAMATGTIDLSLYKKKGATLYLIMVKAIVPAGIEITRGQSIFLDATDESVVGLLSGVPGVPVSFQGVFANIKP